MTESRSGRRGMREVARIAGVTTATVGNALNRPHLVAPATRARIEAAIAQVGLVRSGPARQLRGAASPLVGLVILDLGNPFYSELGRGAEDGLDLCSVAADSRLGGRLAARHLLDLGHRRLAFVRGSHEVPSVVQRFSGAQEAVAARGIDPRRVFRDVRLPAGRPLPRAAEEAVGPLVAARGAPTALFCQNDVIALGLLRGERDADHRHRQTVLRPELVVRASKLVGRKRTEWDSPWKSVCWDVPAGRSAWWGWARGSWVRTGARWTSARPGRCCPPRSRPGCRSSTPRTCTATGAASG